MNELQWINNIKTQQDIERHTEKLLRRMKRNYAFGVSADGSYLMAGYRVYILNDSVVTKEVARIWLSKKVSEIIELYKSKKELEFERKEGWFIDPKWKHVEYITIVHYDDYAIKFELPPPSL